jgi:D-galactarolactone cycloisomerase
MRIAEVKTHVLEARLSQPFSWSFNRTDMRSTCLVEIDRQTLERFKAAGV